RLCRGAVRRRRWPLRRLVLELAADTVGMAARLGLRRRLRLLLRRRETPGRAKAARGAAVAPPGYGKAGGWFAGLSILERDRDGDGLRLATLERSPREFLDAADVDPVFLTSHGVPPMLVLGVQPLTPGFHVNLSIEEIGASLSIGPKRLVRAFVDTTAHRCW